MPKRQSFMDRVQAHERSWGNKNYNGRPSLMEIIAAPVVVFWEHKDKNVSETITLHKDIVEVERYFLRLLFTRQGIEGERRISDVFRDQRRLVIRGVKIQFSEADDE